MNLGSDVVITITGIVLVFAILVLLMLIIMLFAIACTYLGIM